VSDMRPVLSVALVLALAACSAAAQDWSGHRSPPPGTHNIARPDFGLAMSGSSVVDLGLAGAERIGIDEVDDSFGRGPKRLIFRTPRPLMIRADQAVKFRLLVGEVDMVTILPESSFTRV